MQNYEEIREEFSKKLEPIQIMVEKTCWDFYTNSTDENMQKFQQSVDERSTLFQDKNFYEKLNSVDSKSLSKHDQKQLKDLLREFDEEINSGDELKDLRDKENEIAQKFNSYVPKIDGQEVTKTEITKILQTEENPEIRKKAYEAKINGGDLIADDLIEFFKMRNNYAKKKGYENYFEYQLKEVYDVDLNYLEKLIEELYTKSKEQIREIQNTQYKELKEFYKIEKLQSYHYGLLLNSNPSKSVNEALSKYPCEIVEKITKKTYAGMGYDIDEMVNNGKLTLDLYPRKNKNTHGFCFGVEAGKDSRILANLTNNVISIDTLNHEMGHVIYDLGISTELQFLDKQPSSSAMTEAIAMMMGDIMKKEDILKEFISQELLYKFKLSHRKDEANFVSRSLLIIEFEREIYKNPEKNPKELWKNLVKKYLNRDEALTNEWATIPHYLSHPAYYQNYFRANIMKAQIYNYLKSVLGNITENKSTAEFLNKNIFSVGATIDENDLIKQLTGKELSSDDFFLNLL